MSVTDPQWEEALRWVVKASQDRRSAVLMLGDAPPLLDPAAYHCQQAAEKLLKALLAAAGDPTITNQHLRFLMKIIRPSFPEIDIAFL